MDELYKTQKAVQPPIGTSPKEKLHDVLHAKINGPRATNDAAFKSGSVLIEGEYAFFKFDKFYERLKSKDWKYKEEKTGRIMENSYRECDIQFLEQKRLSRVIQSSTFIVHSMMDYKSEKLLTEHNKRVKSCKDCLFFKKLRNCQNNTLLMLFIL